MFSTKNKLTKTVSETKPKSFEERIKEANNVFIETINKLKEIGTDMAEKISNNNLRLKELELENDILTGLKNKTDKQIDQINQLLQ